MTRAEAEVLARAVWGAEGWAAVYEYPDGRDYRIGYYRSGKRGARLRTVRGDSRASFADAAAQVRVGLTLRERARLARWEA